jgi:hypothetical protein
MVVYDQTGQEAMNQWLQAVRFIRSLYDRNCQRASETPAMPLCWNRGSGFSSPSPRAMSFDKRCNRESGTAYRVSIVDFDTNRVPTEVRTREV